MNKQAVNPSDSTMVSNNTMFKVPFKLYSIANWAERKASLLKVLPTQGYTDFFTNKTEGNRVTRVNVEIYSPEF